MLRCLRFVPADRHALSAPRGAPGATVEFSRPSEGASAARCSPVSDQKGQDSLFGPSHNEP